MKSTSKKRYYLDINSTAPLCRAFYDKEQGWLNFSNPSSRHRSGRVSKKIINQTCDFLFDHFNLNSEQFDIVFHSGASEGLQQLFLSANSQKRAVHWSEFDHVAVENLASAYQQQKNIYSISPEGEVKFHAPVLAGDWLQWTWLNNELGNVLELSLALKIAKKHQMRVHVDASQVPGKIENYRKLDPGVDIYTFSGHKFGSLKGVGFSFVKKEVELRPVIIGAGQQEGRRGGTENVHGIHSLQLALEELDQRFDKASLLEKRKKLSSILSELLAGKGEFLSENYENRSLNTLYFYLDQIPSDRMLAILDMNGLECSAGSACSSGSALASRILTALEVAPEKRKNGIRLSFGHDLSFEDIDEIGKRLQAIFKKL